MLAEYKDKACIDVFDRIASMSNLFNVYYMHDANETESFYKGYIQLNSATLCGNGEQAHAVMTLEIREAEDMLALKDLFNQYREFDKRVREGNYTSEDGLSILTQGKHFSFKAKALGSMGELADDAVYDFDESVINYVQIGVNMPGEFLPVVGLSPYTGRYSALCIEHDLNVIAELIAGTPINQIEQAFLMKKKRLEKQAYKLEFTMVDGVLHVKRGPAD